MITRDGLHHSPKGKDEIDKMNKTAKHTVILMVTTVLAKVLGFAREIVLAYRYGAGSVSDAYIIAYSIPTVIFAGLGTAILTSYIPMYTQMHEQSPRKLRRFNNNVTTIVLLLSAAILLVFWLFDDSIVQLFAVGFTGETLDFAVRMARVMMISVLFIGVSNILQGYLQIHDSFAVVGMVSVPQNIFVIASILLTATGDSLVLGVGLVLGYAASMMMLYLSSKKKGFSYRPYLSLRDPNIRQMVILVLPIFLGRTVMQINTMIDRTIASTLPTGSVSALNYASRIFGFVISVFVLSVATAIFPQLSIQTARNSMKRFKATIRSSIGIVTLLVLPISAGAIVLAEPIVKLLFGRGEFDEAAIRLTAECLSFYCIGLIFYSLKDILNNVFYAMQDTRTPTVNSVINVALNIVLNLALVGPMAHRGLALATSLSSGITLLMLLWCLHQKVGPMGLRALSKSILKMLAGTGLMTAVVVPLWAVLGPEAVTPQSGVLVPLIVSVGAGAVVYVVALILMRTREMGELIVGIANALSRKKAPSQPAS